MLSGFLNRPDGLNITAETYIHRAPAIGRSGGAAAGVFSDPRRAGMTAGGRRSPEVRHRQRIRLHPANLMAHFRRVRAP